VTLDRFTASSRRVFETAGWLALRWPGRRGLKDRLSPFLFLIGGIQGRGATHILGHAGLLHRVSGRQMVFKTAPAGSALRRVRPAGS
jgi:hypothetical protein